MALSCCKRISRSAPLRGALAVLLCAALMFAICTFLPRAAFADDQGNGYTPAEVKGLIEQLPNDPEVIMGGDPSLVERVVEAYDSLNEEDRAALDKETGVPGTVQSYGRVLEAAQWAIWSLSEPDNRTALKNGTYDATTTPALAFEYSKGKSTSSRDHPWSVASVEVREKRAYATITVKSDTYTHISTGGKVYQNVNPGGNSTFVGVPIALNSTFYLAGYSTSMKQYIMFSLTTAIDESDSTVVVTFTDGLGNTLDLQELPYGGTATPPPDPTREKYVFAGWDKSFTNVKLDTTVNATWVEEGATLHTVAFVDGLGHALKTQKVKHGEAATAPDDPTRDGYLFDGWKPASFGKITADLTVEASWISVDDAKVREVREKVAALSADPTTVLGDTGNVKVAAAGEAYNALSDDLKAKVPDADRLLLVKSMIAVLPTDPYDVTSADQAPIMAAGSAYESLPSGLSATLGKDTVIGIRTYAYYLQSAEWALDSLTPVSNRAILVNGVYTSSVKGESNMGKSSSSRKIAFTVKNVIVKDGRATALIEHGSNSSQTLRVGGKEYQNLQADPSKRSLFEIPVELNKTFHFAVKGKNATEATSAIMYEMTISGDTATMKPDSSLPGEGSSKDSGDSGNGSADSGGESGGGPDASGSGSGASNAQGGTAGNLGLLVTNNTSSSTARSSSSASALNSSASASANSSASTSTGEKQKDSSGAKPYVTEVTSGTDADTGAMLAAAAAEMMPGVVGIMMLCAALGALGFTLRFVRREGV